MKQYICLACGDIYDEDLGSPEHGIPPGTRFEDLPPDWECPYCGADKTHYEVVE